ncbi:zinc-ribbon domain-containing protein [Anaplasma capra]|uniref:zinc-ribbon domain-containing protein n=1 Tax=Anaplasma capra TaxID=1562740 RepID=UPI0021D5B214|nr:zinc-ribbon domain-containing protein [Anaplasma capra]MCU7611212.1 zinc-ribbon domain-containing protein [Anaplasma capra]MCU7612284.1 zinc-ribbon domain-containing protein [Anaplasma capra]
MKIKCKNCSATYNVVGDKIPAKGKKVKCTNCGNVWLFSPEEGEVPPVTTPTPGQGRRRSKGREPLTWKDCVLIVMMLPLVFFFSSTFQKKIPYKFRRAYRLTEIYDTSRMRLLESQVKILGTEEQEMVVKVSWVVENTADDERFIPGVYLIFYDKNLREVFSQKVEVNKYGLIPGNTRMAFEKTVGGVPSSVETVKVKAGNAFEVLFY